MHLALCLPATGNGAPGTLPTNNIGNGAPGTLPTKSIGSSALATRLPTSVSQYKPQRREGSGGVDAWLQHGPGTEWRFHYHWVDRARVARDPLVWLSGSRRFTARNSQTRRSQVSAKRIKGRLIPRRTLLDSPRQERMSQEWWRAILHLPGTRRWVWDRSFDLC